MTCSALPICRQCDHAMIEGDGYFWQCPQCRKVVLVDDGVRHHDARLKYPFLIVPGNRTRQCLRLPASCPCYLLGGDDIPARLALRCLRGEPTPPDELHLPEGHYLTIEQAVQRAETIGTPFTLFVIAPRGATGYHMILGPIRASNSMVLRDLLASFLAPPVRSMEDLTKMRV